MKKTPTRRLVWSAIALVCGGASCSQEARLTGSVIGADGQPEAGATLRLERGTLNGLPALDVPLSEEGEWSPFKELTTDATGAFSLVIEEKDIHGDGLEGFAEYRLVLEGGEREASTTAQLRFWKGEDVELPPLMRWIGEETYDSRKESFTTPAPVQALSGLSADDEVVRQVIFTEADGSPFWIAPVPDDGAIKLLNVMRGDRELIAHPEVRIQGRSRARSSVEAEDLPPPFWLKQHRAPFALPKGSLAALTQGRAATLTGATTDVTFVTDGEAKEVSFAPDDFILTLNVADARVVARSIVIRGLRFQGQGRQIVVEIDSPELSDWRELQRISPSDEAHPAFIHVQLAFGTQLRFLRLRTEKVGSVNASTGCCTTSLREVSVY
jgi:hypothetical protein